MSPPALTTERYCPGLHSGTGRCALFLGGPVQWFRRLALDVWGGRRFGKVMGNNAWGWERAGPPQDDPLFPLLNHWSFHTIAWLVKPLILASGPFPTSPHASSLSVLLPSLLSAWMIKSMEDIFRNAFRERCKNPLVYLISVSGIEEKERKPWLWQQRCVLRHHSSSQPNGSAPSPE